MATARTQSRHCADCGAVTASAQLLHWDEVCPHCVNVRRSVALTGTYDGPLFPKAKAKSVCYQTYRQACEAVGGTLRTLPLSDHPHLHFVWTSLLPSPPPDRTMPLPEAVPVRSWTTPEDSELDTELECTG